MRRRLWSLGALAGILASLSCDGPRAGELTLHLTTPNTDDGAVVLRVLTADPDVITGATAACGGCRIFPLVVSDTELRAVVTGDINAGLIARIAVSDVKKPSTYSAQVSQVASRAFVLLPASSYAITIQ